MTTRNYKPRPRAGQVRCVYTDAPGRAMPEHSGKVFAVIGPFEGFADKDDLRDAIEFVLRGYNCEPRTENERLDESQWPKVGFPGRKRELPRS